MIPRAGVGAGPAPAPPGRVMKGFPLRSSKFEISLSTSPVLVILLPKEWLGTRGWLVCGASAQTNT